MKKIPVLLKQPPVMEFGFRRVGAASCRIVNADCLPEHMHSKIREVISVHVPKEKRGQGYASTLMHKVCREADDAGITLFLKVEPFEDGLMAREDLAGWYARAFGFAAIQAEPLLMARMPWSTPKIGLPNVSIVTAATQEAIAHAKDDAK